MSIMPGQIYQNINDPTDLVRVADAPTANGEYFGVDRLSLTNQFDPYHTWCYHPVLLQHYEPYTGDVAEKLFKMLVDL